MARNRTALPFTEEEDRDGSMYVWFILGQAGLDYPYTKAAEFPRSTIFTGVETPQGGDIAWWKGFVALYRAADGKLLTGRGEEPLRGAEMMRGKVTWFRYAGPPAVQHPLPAKSAPRKALKTVDEALARLNAAATFPPRVKNDVERDLLRKEWGEAIAGLEALRKRYPDDPQLLRRIGVCYRRGYNLEMPGAWERAEAYLLRTETLAPEAPEAYISLGILYTDIHVDYAPQAEAQFRKALPLARKEQLPQVWWGLALALYNQGKLQEALTSIDRLIALHPEAANAQQLREKILQATNEKGKGR